MTIRTRFPSTLLMTSVRIARIRVFACLTLLAACGSPDANHGSRAPDAAVRPAARPHVAAPPVADAPPPTCTTTGAVMGTLYYSRAAGDGNDGRIYSAHGDGTGEAFVTVGNIPHLAPSGKY